MNHDIQVILIVCLMIVFMVMMKGRRSGLRQLGETIAELQARPPAPPPAAGPTQEAFDRLEQRLQVLERIVTDKSYDLAGQIEALRDARPAAAPAPRVREETR